MADTAVTIDVTPDVVEAFKPTPQPEEKEVVDTKVVFVPFDDFEGRINQEPYQFRKDVPSKISKAEANVWIEANKGYIK